MKIYQNILFIYLSLLTIIIGGCKDKDTIIPNLDPIPRIITLSPENVGVGDVLTINGINFSESPSENEVKLGQTIVEVLSATAEKIEVKIPELTSNILGVSVRTRGKISNKVNISLVKSKIFTDDFNRTDVPLVTSATNPNPIGSNWQIVQGVFSLKSNQLFTNAGGVDSYMLYRDAELSMKAGEGNFFKLNAELKATTGNFVGLIFNAQSDNMRFYLLRILDRTVQLLKTNENGLNNWASILINQEFEGFAAGVPYLIEVSSSQAGSLRIVISNKDTNGILLEQTVTDSSPYVGGSPGFYYFGLANPVDIVFDNLKVETL
ncbi:IPT/TIG domain-containing protein [Sphingobacterium sp. HJSM2_6]|uniref:IPT/TIG domain-containing protein n=1 Tax=Sphingobacterium sp. HJSM2_6 TaxID=3366264 RepID=UPI003BB9D3DA